MYVGINSYFEHPSVAFVSNGQLLFAAEDERFTRVKGGKHYSPYSAYLPLRALFAGFKTLGVRARDIRGIGFSYSPRDHLMGSLGCFTGRRLSSISEELSGWWSALGVKRLLRSGYGHLPEYCELGTPEELKRIPFRYLTHHLCHAASSFALSGFDESLIITADGSGEDLTIGLYHGRGNKITLQKHHRLPHSLGFLYSFVTRHLGFQAFSDEYKVMGLAAYGTNCFSKEFEQLVKLLPGGGFALNFKLLRNLERLLGPPRLREEEISERHMAIARSLQERLEGVLFHVLTDARKRFGLVNLCCAGGVFMNCVFNGKLAASQLFNRVYFVPAADDSGTAVGAAALLEGRASRSPLRISSTGMYLGTEYSSEEIQRVLRSCPRIRYQMFDGAELALETARRLAAGEIGAVFRGRMEFGQRALGNRSILADPGIPAITEHLNQIKGRELFRPVAPIVPAERFSEYFSGVATPFMMTTCLVREQFRKMLHGVAHIDGSARVQIVDVDSNPFVHNLLSEFSKQRGYPVLINTSFNINGQPMIEHPLDALKTLLASNLSFLVVGNYLVEPLG